MWKQSNIVKVSKLKRRRRKLLKLQPHWEVPRRLPLSGELRSSRPRRFNGSVVVLVSKLTGTVVVVGSLVRGELSGRFGHSVFGSRFLSLILDSFCCISYEHLHSLVPGFSSV